MLDSIHLLYNITRKKETISRLHDIAQPIYNSADRFKTKIKAHKNYLAPYKAKTLE